MEKILKFLVSILCIVTTLMVSPSFAYAQIQPDQLSKAVEEIEYLDAMRLRLASTIEGTSETVDMDTFKKTCKPVGMKAQELSKTNDWEVKQISLKYRNPDHKPDGPQSLIALTRFRDNPDLRGFWHRENHNGQQGTRYYRRIDLDNSCLVCHGPKNNRPEFIKNNYPQDLAYDFKTGDLRGMYAVFIPDLQKILKDNLPIEEGES